MASSTVEDYLKAILLGEQGRPAGELVTMGEIAAALAVAPGTVTAMVKSLERDGLVAYAPYSGVRLTDRGRSLGIHMVRRHRLIELFLVEVLGLDWSEVHEEAERLEHAMSDKLIDRIDAHLGHPRVDPHGDPIPGPEGELPKAELVSLKDCARGRRVRIARVSDQNEAFLRFVEQHGLKPGVWIAVSAHDPVADAVSILPEGGAEVTLGGEAAAKLWVEVAAPTAENS